MSRLRASIASIHLSIRGDRCVARRIGIARAKKLHMLCELIPLDVLNNMIAQRAQFIKFKRAKGTEKRLGNTDGVQRATN
eukprot:9991488-Heterocapsa_arctica.AAC.1